MTARPPLATTSGPAPPAIGGHGCRHRAASSTRTGGPPRRLPSLQARYRDLAAEITRTGFTATGTLLRSHNVCGSAGCACHTDPGRRHGPYWQYTRKINGKTVTRRLTSAQAALYAQWIANGRALRDLLTQMRDVSDQARDLILATPQDDRQPGT